MSQAKKSKCPSEKSVMVKGKTDTFSKAALTKLSKTCVQKFARKKGIFLKVKGKERTKATLIRKLVNREYWD